MATTITGKLNQNATSFQAGESIGFGIKLGVKFYNRETQQDEYTNYEAAIFSRNQNQVNFLTGALVKGAVVEVSAEKLQINIFADNQGMAKGSIKMINATLGYIHTPQQVPAQNQVPMNQAPQQQAVAQQPHQGQHYQGQQRQQAAQQRPQQSQGAPQQQAPQMPAQQPPQQQGGGFEDFNDDIPL